MDNLASADQVEEDIEILEDDNPLDEACHDKELDFSQSHLDEFLTSQNKTLLKGANIQSGQLLSSFVTTVNRMKQSSKEIHKAS